MKPFDFYEMETEDFVLKVEGFLNKKDWLEGCFRRLATIIMTGIPYKNQPPSIEKLWPMRKDRQNKKRAKERTDKTNANTKAFWEKNLKIIDAYNKALKR